MIATLKAFDTTAKVIFGLLVLGIVLSLGMAVLTMRSSRHDTRKAEAGQTFAEARTGAAQDASAVRDRADARNDQISNAVQEGTSDVRQAADRSAATRAARRGVCRVNPGAGPDCRVLLADPARVD